MNVPINKGVVSEVSVKYADTSGKIMNKKSEGNIEQEIIINDNVSAPIEAGQVLGRVEFKVDGEAVASVELVAENDVAKLNIFTMGKRILKKWFYLFRN